MALSIIRHEEIFNPRDHDTPIFIIGAGATGSRVFMALIELGLQNITVIDPDIIEPHNLANQAYTFGQIGMPKVEAMEELYQSKTGEHSPDSMQFIRGRVPEDVSELRGVVFLLTDTMESRREIYERCIKDSDKITCVVETRMASTHGNVFCFSPYDFIKTEAWERTLIDDGEAEVSACGGTLAVGTTASIIANLAVWQFMHAMSEPMAVDDSIALFLKPAILSTEKLTWPSQESA